MCYTASEAAHPLGRWVGFLPVSVSAHPKPTIAGACAGMGQGAEAQKQSRPLEPRDFSSAFHGAERDTGGLHPGKHAVPWTGL